MQLESIRHGVENTHRNLRKLSTEKILTESSYLGFPTGPTVCDALVGMGIISVLTHILPPGALGLPH